MDLISVLMCVNRIDDFFIRAIDSLNEQTYKNFEIVLVGNTLSEQDKKNVVDLAAKFPKVRVFFTEVKFLTFSLNLGLHHCAGSLVARMDADDIAYPERLEKQAKFMNEHQEIDVCGSCCYLIDSLDQVVGTHNVPLLDGPIKQALYWNAPFCHPTVMFRKAVILKIGGYMGGLYAEDYDLWCRLKLDVSIRFANLPEKLLGYRFAPNGLARRSKYAYAGLSAAQWRSFVVTGNVMWLLGAILSAIKRLARAKQ